MTVINNTLIIKKIIIFTNLFFSFYILNAQPIPDCASEKGIKIILKGNDEFSCSLSPSFNLNDCFFIHHSYIKDSLGITYFKFDIYKNIIDAGDDTWKGKKMYLKDSVYTHKVRDVAKMRIYVGNFDKNDHISFYLEISEFKKGSFFIDVKKNATVKYDNMKSVKYNNSFNGIQAFDITPEKWSETKKWGD